MGVQLVINSSKFIHIHIFLYDIGIRGAVLILNRSYFCLFVFFSAFWRCGVKENYFFWISHWYYCSKYKILRRNFFTQPVLVQKLQTRRAKFWIRLWEVSPQILFRNASLNLRKVRHYKGNCLKQNICLAYWQEGSSVPWWLHTNTSPCCLCRTCTPEITNTLNEDIINLRSASR